MGLGKLNIRDLYFYLVCFMSIVIFVMGMVQGVENLLDIVYPDPDSPWVIEKYDRQIEEGKMTPQEAQHKIEEMQRLERERNRVRNIKELAQNIVMIGVAIPLFAIHWKHASKTGE